jgi:hypothetical protein
LQGNDAPVAQRSVEDHRVVTGIVEGRRGLVPPPDDIARDPVALEQDADRFGHARMVLNNQDSGHGEDRRSSMDRV